MLKQTKNLPAKCLECVGKGCKDEEQMTYVETRLEDLEDIDTPIKHDDYEIQDCLRLFSGDGPARQFEGGQQRGGNYPCLCGVHAEQHTNLLHCFHVSAQDLDDRCSTIGDKNQIKGSDARLFLIKLAQFTSDLHEDNASDITISYQPDRQDYEAITITKENDEPMDQIRDSSHLPVDECTDSNDEVSNAMEEGCTLLKVKPSRHSDPPEVHVLAVDHQRKQQENSKTKDKYKSYIKVLRWAVQHNSTDAHENLITKPKPLPAKKPLSCKRKLFDSEISNQEFASRRKKTTFDLVVQLLGPSSDVEDCIKYRELKLKHPGHKSFISAFDQSFSKLQIQVSKKYFALKEETTKDDGKENRENLLADKEIAQKLLDHWGMYYF
ncbi:uncharacterized protein LOC127714002 [Mytilus californianus]|uniref:uncharacterized protein LOC127714002 n=1 Tax=Mytilus californianus TaxID=6549 RepID=UPI0022450882|nr:uncharacterized protein LOC127714002 [Mytilus californianus]